MTKLLRRSILVALPLLGAAACAPAPTVGEMVPLPLPGLQLAPAWRNAITVGSVTIGPDTGTPWRASVAPDQVKEATVQALASAGLGAASGGRYRLDATLLQLDRPYAGFAMTVTATIAWRLVDATSGAVVYDRTLRGLGTATLNDAVDNDPRLRLADQRAVRANLQQLVYDLAALQAPPAPSTRR
jgi:hypothetical protein